MEVKAIYINPIHPPFFSFFPVELSINLTPSNVNFSAILNYTGV